MRIIAFISIVLLFSACNESNKHDSNLLKRAIDINTISEYEFNDLIESVEIFPLETNDETLIGRVTKFIYHNENIYILDRHQKSIFTFDLNGNLINKLHRVGKGKGEYLDICDFAVNPYNDNIETIDARVLRIYDGCGEFISEKKVVTDKISYVHNMEIVDSTIIAFISKSNENDAFLYSRETNSFVKEQCIYPKWARKNIPFGTLVSMYRNDNELFYYKAFSNKVYSIDKDGYKLSYEWDFGQYNFNYEEPPLFEEFQSSSSSGNKNGIRQYYKEKFIVQFQHNIQNRAYLITNFWFKDGPATMLFNKTNNKYIVVKGDLSMLFYAYKTAFIEKRELLLIIDPKMLKMRPQEWFSAANLKIIDETDIMDNPLILKIKLNTELID